jgi:ADP-heptose:LPS heptosyltransferase
MPPIDSASQAEKTHTMTFHRILLLNRNHIGDCLFTTPAIRALRTAYPEAVLIVAVPSMNQDLLASNPCLSEVLVRPLRGVTDQLRLLREIRRRRFDLVISFQEKSFFYAALARLSGARLTVSLQHWRTQAFYHRIVPVVPGRHEVEKYHAIVEAVVETVLPGGRGDGDRSGATPGGRRGDLAPKPAPSPRLPVPRSFHPPGGMELHVSREHRAHAEALLAEWGVEENALLIGINPGATMRVKRWPVERFAAVGRELVARYDAQILVFGGPDDGPRAAAISRAIPRAISVAGRTRLGETAALLRRCRLLVSGDTGPLHMAVALGVPAIGLFGPTNPGKYGPWSVLSEGRHRATVLRHPEPCQECSRPCVHTISAAECLAAADAWLDQKEAPAAAGAAASPARRVPGERVEEAQGVRFAAAGREAWENA